MPALEAGARSYLTKYIQDSSVIVDSIRCVYISERYFHTNIAF
jgi:DNA-binding NarL/FixJ family response regulator